MEFKGNIEEITKKNKLYRRVLHTNANQQLVVMNLLPLQEIGLEVHPNTSQFIRVEDGKGIAVINGNRYFLKDGDAVIVPAGSYHNILNTSRKDCLKIYTLYSPPHHPRDYRQKVKHKED